MQSTTTLNSHLTTQSQISETVHQARDTVSNALANHNFMAYTETAETRSLNFLGSPTDPPSLSYLLQPDGQIEATLNGVPHDPRLDLHHQAFDTMVQRAIAELVAQQTLSLLSEHRLHPDALMSPETVAAIDSAAEHLLRELKARDHHPPWLQTLRASTAITRGGSRIGLATYILEYLLSRQENWLLLEHIFDSYEGYSVSQYNLMARNGPVFRTMAKQESPPLHFYCKYLAPLDNYQATFHHPGEIITLLKDHLNLTPAQWRVFSNIPAKTWGSRAPQPTTVAKACTVLAKANVQNPHPDSLKHIVPLLCRHDTDLLIHWSHGDPSDAWAGLTRAFLLADNYHHSFYQSYPQQTLLFVADALRQSLQQDHPWGPGNWDTLKTRSDRWHEQIRQLAQQEDELRRQERLAAQWPSALPQTSIGEFTFTPVTSGAVLAHLGDSMGNCLASYWRSCLNGSTRIFTVENDAAEHLAAVEIYLQDSQWQPGQAEGPGHAPPPKGIRPALNRLAQAYQAASTQHHPEETA